MVRVISDLTRPRRNADGFAARLLRRSLGLTASPKDVREEPGPRHSPAALSARNRFLGSGAMSIMETQRRLKAMFAALPRTPVSDGPPDAAVTVFYNGSNPLCRFEMERYQRLGGGDPAALVFVDVSRAPEALARHGLTIETATRRLYVLHRTAATPDGALVRGADAFILLWRQMPRYRWLARLCDLPGGRRVAILAYEGVLVPVLWAWNRRKTRRLSEALLTRERRKH